MMTRGKILVAVLAFLSLLTGCATTSGVDGDSVGPGEVFFDVPIRGQRSLEPVGELPRVIDESSGLTQSTREPGIFWTLNDSGDSARIFAVSATGEMLSPGTSASAGVPIKGAVNRDWESLARDFQGGLLIGAFGNNGNRRRNLAIYRVAEPDPLTALEANVDARWPFHYPDQTEFPPTGNNFDCEAMFVAGGQIYLITKHRADSMATLYRLASPSEMESNTLTLLTRANFRGQVTGAGSWNDGERIAVLTYMSAWVFDPPERDGDRLFEGTVRWLPIRAGQAEAIDFLDRETLVITNEQRDVYHLPVAEMETVSVRE